MLREVLLAKKQRISLLINIHLIIHSSYAFLNSFIARILEIAGGFVEAVDYSRYRFLV